MASEIEALRPDLVCLTEARNGSAHFLRGFSCASEGVAWSKTEADECKVLLWSNSEFTAMGETRELEKIGGALSIVTQIQGSAVHVVGLCIPYHMASPHLAAVRSPPWQEHIRFLNALSEFLDNLDRRLPTIILGDFNRRIPSSWGSKEAFRLLQNCLSGMNLATAGQILPKGKKTIDHVAVSKEFNVKSVTGLSQFDDKGRARSDHFGVVVDVELSA